MKIVKQCLDDDKAQNIVSIELKGKSAIADYFVIASGTSQRHVSAMANQISRILKGAGQKNIFIEGAGQCDWVLIDIGDVIVHIFRPEVRAFYDLEKIWMVTSKEEKSNNTIIGEK